jgi:hypothetical protein
MNWRKVVWVIVLVIAFIPYIITFIAGYYNEKLHGKLIQLGKWSMKK